MFQVQDACRETVNLWYALIFGADGACVELSVWTIMQVILPFAVLVTVLQVLANKLIFSHRANDLESTEKNSANSGRSDEFPGPIRRTNW